MPIKQRKMRGKEAVSVGAKVDKIYHDILKEVARNRSVSMSTLVDEAVQFYVKNALNIKLEEITNDNTGFGR